MPFPFLAAAAVGLPFIGSAIQGGLNYTAQRDAALLAAQISRENTDKTIRANREMAEYAYARDLDMWRKGNQYNSPQEQMLRLKAAGLNPMLAYGNGSVAGQSAGPPPRYQAPEQNYAYQAPAAAQLNVDFNQLGLLSAYQDIQLKKTQIDNVAANTKATEQSTANAKIQNALLAIEKLFATRKHAATTSQEETKASYLAREKMVDLVLKSISSASAAQSYRQSAALFPYDLQFKRGQVKQQGEQTKEIMERIKGYPLQRQKLYAEIMSTKAATDLTTSKGKTEELTRILMDKDRLLKQYEIYLRERGTYEGDTPWGKGTRDFSQFIHWLTTKF